MKAKYFKFEACLTHCIIFILLHKILSYCEAADMAFLTVFMAQNPFLAWQRKKSVKIIQTAEKIFQNQIPQNE